MTTLTTLECTNSTISRKSVESYSREMTCRTNSLRKITAAPEGPVPPQNSHKALGVPQLTVGVDNFLLRFEALAAPRAHHRLQRHPGQRIIQ